MNLEIEFRKLWVRLGCQGRCEFEWFRREERYAQPWRYYHTLIHIEHMLRELVPILSRLQRPDEALWTAFDHDVLYIPVIRGKRVTDNELQSALFAGDTLRAAKVENTILVRIGLQILATGRRPQALDDDTKYVLDADKAILGQRWAVYGQYAFSDIPQEYLACSVKRKTFTAGRLAFLQKLREEPIYLTDHFRQLYEEMARLNIDQEIRILTEQMNKA